MKQRTPFMQGMRDGIPIGLGYFAVAFSLGIIAGNLQVPASWGFVGSWLIHASAGEYGAYTMIAAQASVMGVIGMAIVTNLRYMLMSTAITQRFRPGIPLWHRILVGCCMTDEIFGISIAYPAPLPVSYPIGAFLLAGTMWAAGTACGIVAGNVLPAGIVSALSVALYGMFIAIIIPPSRQDKAIAITVAVSFLLSGLCSITPWLCTLSSGMRTILLTIVISAAAALIKPIDVNKKQ